MIDPTYQAVREKVIAANQSLNPEIASWEGAPGEWRCILSEEGKNSYFKRNSDRIKKENRYGIVADEKENMVLVWWDGKNTPQWLHRDWVAPSTVDGRIVRLADVLLAIDKMDDIECGINSDGEFVYWKSPKEGGGNYRRGPIWNLRKDSLSEQSPECWEFLNRILV